MPVSVNDIDAILPQTQCGDCGYDGCLPYATALANGEAEINLCPPGGERGLRRLGQLLNQPIDEYLADFQSKASTVAVIDESLCIGCVKCISACPVDAIVGSRKLMHTVITDQCTGCQLCVEPCPMDCIDMQATAERDDAEQDTLAKLSRQRYQARNARLEHLEKAKKKQHQQAIPSDPRAAIAAALARKKQV